MVFDASVLAKLFVAEDLSHEARQLVGAAGEVWTPAHALAELAEILCRKVALSEISSEQCDLALATTWDKRLLRGVQGTRFEKTTRPLLSSWTP